MAKRPNDDPTMDRRSLLRRGAYVTGGLAFAGSFGGLLTACGDDGDSAASTSDTTPASTGASAATGSTTTKGAPTKMAYQLSWLPTVEHAGAYIAKTKGYYTANGVDVELIPGGPNVQVPATVSSGKALVGGSNADSVANAILQGAKLKIFATRFQKSPFCILSHGDNPLKSPQDLIGKKIGVAQSNTTPFQLMLKLNNIDPSKLTVVPVQFDPTPVANKEVDGQIVFIINEPGQLRLKGVNVATFLLADFGYSVYSGCYFTTDDALKNNKEQLVEFLRAEKKGWEENLANPKVGADLTSTDFGKSLGLDPAHQQWESEELAKIMVTDNTKKNGILSLDSGDIAKNISTLATAGINIQASQLFTDEILKAL